jgi:hypothetical protein
MTSGKPVGVVALVVETAVVYKTSSPFGGEVGSSLVVVGKVSSTGSLKSESGTLNDVFSSSATPLDGSTIMVGVSFDGT